MKILICRNEKHRKKKWFQILKYHTHLTLETMKNNDIVKLACNQDIHIQLQWGACTPDSSKRFAAFFSFSIFFCIMFLSFRKYVKIDAIWQQLPFVQNSLNQNSIYNDNTLIPILVKKKEKEIKKHTTPHIATKEKSYYEPLCCLPML